MNYNALINKKLNTLKESGQYRTFQTINRIKGSYPEAYADDMKGSAWNSEIILR